jgi:hypothetical protein
MKTEIIVEANVPEGREIVVEVSEAGVAQTTTVQNRYAGFFDLSEGQTVTISERAK